MIGQAQLIIPVYQRNYDWKVENCNQLYNDLVKLKKSGRPNHRLMFDKVELSQSELTFLLEPIKA